MLQYNDDDQNILGDTLIVDDSDDDLDNEEEVKEKEDEDKVEGEETVGLEALEPDDEDNFIIEDNMDDFEYADNA
ncbi:MAG: hypothetical protein UT86_C0001G0204 [Candidatus Magasanikbacteria bacterium GW2011_GWC2_40_17]|uniref:Uncharacterized protein n=1 Tax=Candidatus Magasanikbacteria bacterium GW2011_GWA2_42_32 TaxID=1619039 RepID=A0A0G1A999_9BACT|nr:MAG: hypothetical protein UT86_C0001G0204 [Candidatus Magasanikbacteria bacterium GW2011_GWC2_40_17]KKS57564.1 MAG: hypothetical protein UV20_C0001G0204 [Candidatus Magasanikbacteria bacterium GW2011_GWA2_42_32]OGH85439.1 MAG: hypothetical protein A2294_03480 [Candidatus Magasanikbacteria bacterium RIFOXYB2_FULL_38_10]